MVTALLQAIGGFMQSSHILNLGPNHPGNVDPEPARPVADPQVSDLIEKPRADVRRTRTQLERQEDQQELQVRRTKTLSIVLLALVVILAGGFWYVYPSVSGHQKSAAEMLGLQKVTGSLGEHVQSLEAKFN